MSQAIPKPTEVDPAPESTELRKTACPLDCPDTCGLEVTIGIDATTGEQRVEHLGASGAHPLTGGFICSKVRRLPQHLYGSERLRYPMLRAESGGDFERISWDRAFDILSQRLGALRDRGLGEAILPLSYGGSNGLLSQDTLDARLFTALGSSRLARTVCAAPSSAAHAGLYGGMAGIPLEDYAESKLIVIWGCNPSATGIHFVPIVKQARAKGARLVVIDPRAIPLALDADLHLAPRPGTDLALALALHRALFDRDLADHEFLGEHCRNVDEFRRRCADWTVERAAEVTGIEPSQIERFADLYATSSPAAIRCGWGVERNRSGGSAVAAILALPAVAGKFSVRGGGFTMSNSGAWKLDKALEVPPGSTRVVNMNHVGRALVEADPRIELLFVYNNNPLATLPNQELVRQGLERTDLFTVVFDQVMTDTARLADLLLPATTFLEHRDIAKSYGSLQMQPVVPVIEPVGEAKDNHDVFLELCDRLGIDTTDDREREQLTRRMLSRHEPQALSSLSHGQAAVPSYGSNPIQFVDVFPNTPDRKIDLVPKHLDSEAPEGLYSLRQEPAGGRFPLTLISPATSKRTSSTFGQLHHELTRLEIHPRDAEQRGLSSSTPRVKVFNDLGEVICGLRITDRVRIGTVVLPKGLWSHNTINGATANALAPDHLADLGGGACFNDARVEVVSLEGAV